VTGRLSARGQLVVESGRMTGFRRILAAVDFSPPTAEVLAAAGAFARAWQARLVLLHVLPLREMDTGGAQAELDASVPPALTDLVDERRVTRSLAAELGIVEEARQAGADLIVVGTHGRTGLPHIRLGSVAARVVENAPVPVLAVRMPPAARPAS
jgi:nucleotide-binding universal stress UspA family protein